MYLYPPSTVVKSRRTVFLQVCSFPNPVSHRDLLTCDDASCLTSCHRAICLKLVSLLQNVGIHPLGDTAGWLDCRSWVYNVPVLKSALPLRITESMVWFSGWTLSSRA